MDNHQTPQNSIYPRCVDGRAGEVFLEGQDKTWTVVKRGADAHQENGPQFLGASLLFVRALEVVAEVGQLRAFELTESASKAAGIGLQIHEDDHHSHYDFTAMSDDDLAALMGEHHSGCGFAAYSWADEADSIIRQAKLRGWRVQLLVGDHAEQGAIVNFRADETFNTAAAVQAGASAFNTDVLAARKVFEALEGLLEKPGFAQEAEAWMLKTYEDVVILLKGVQSADEIVTLN